jgi:hypothetical protein
MALKYPSANGNWSNAANWNGGTLPVAGDDVRANGFTITIDVDINVLQISTAALLPANAGGGFTVSTNRTLTCNIIGGTTNCLSSTVGNTVNIIGNITGGSNFAQFVVNFTNAGSILNVTGNALAPTSGGGAPQALNSAGTVNFVGNASAGAGNPSGGAAINILVTGVLTFTGIASGGSGIVGCYGIQCFGSSTLNGSITAGSSVNSSGVRISGGTHTINSDCTGVGGGAGTYACLISTATATFNGNITGSTSSTSVGLYVADTISTVVISTMTFSTNGGVPLIGFVKFKNTAPTITVTKANSTTQQLVDPLTTDIPIASNVRNGITYSSGALTGTLKVPPVTAVSVGVPTDNTVGTAVITISDMGALLASYNA